MVKSCAALGCTYDWSTSKSDDANISFHKFPLRHPDLLEVWTTRIGRSAFMPTEHSRLCSRHFQRTDFNNPDAPKHRRLRDDAIPSLNLPNFPVGDGVGSSMSEDPRLHATMAPQQERTSYPNPMPALPQAVPSAAAHLCNAAHVHAQQIAHPQPHPLPHPHPHPHNNENGPRDSLDWLNNNSHHTFSDGDNVLEENNELGWPPNLQQQQQQQRLQQQAQQQPAPSVNAQPSQAIVDKQMEVSHQSAQSRSSPNILSTDSGSEEEEEEQPPIKKPCFGNLHVNCDMDTSEMQQAAHRQGSSVSVNSFCPSHGHKQTLIATAALGRGPVLEPRALLQNKMSGKKRKASGLRSVVPEEKAASPVSSWDSLWSNVGHAVRVVAEAVAFFLLTKADISREQHQMQMEQCRRNIQQASCSCNANNNYREWEAGSDVNSTQESESEQADVENILDQNSCLKSEPDDAANKE